MKANSGFIFEEKLNFHQGSLNLHTSQTARLIVPSKVGSAGTVLLVNKSSQILFTDNRNPNWWADLL